MKSTHRARLSPRGLALLLALALLCFQGLGFSHAHGDDGCPKAPPGYLRFALDPVQGTSPHLQAGEAPPILCLQCALASQGAHQPGGAPSVAPSSAPRPAPAVGAAAPAIRPVLLAPAGRAPPAFA